MGCLNDVRREVIQVTLVSVCMAVTVFGYDALYATHAHRVPLGAAAATGLVAGLLARGVADPSTSRRRTGIAYTLALPVLGVPAWLLAAPHPWVSPSTLVDGPVRLLTFNQPVDVTAPLLAGPFTVTALATYAATLLLLAPAASAPIIPLTIAYSVQLLLCAGLGSDAIAAIVFAGAAGGLLAVDGWVVPTDAPRAGGTHIQDWWPRIRRRVAVLATVAVTAACTAAAVDALDPDRLDPRDNWSAGDPELAEVTPLGMVKAELQDGRALRFAVRLSGHGSAATDRLVIATLDRFDGSAWTADPDFRTSGRVLRRMTPAPSAASDTELAAAVHITTLPGRLLPAPARAFAMPALPAADAVAFDPAVGLVARRDPSGWDYTVESTDSSASDDLSPTERDRDLHVEAKDAEALRVVRDEWLPATEPDARTLAALAQDMRERLPYSPDGPAGHSIAAVVRVLSGTAPVNGGFSEQHASAFTLLARLSGRPARVVVGYRLKAPDASGRYEVRARDAHAWSEVWLDDHWASFDPTDVDKPVTPFPGVAPVAAEPLATDSTPPPPSPLTPEPPDESAWLDSVRTAGPWFVFALLVLTLLVGVAIVVRRTVQVRAVRTRRRAQLLAAQDEWERRAQEREARRSAGTPAGRVLGAWAEALDALLDEGLTLPESGRPSRVLDTVKATSPGPLGPLTQLGRLTDRALFHPRPPTAAEAEFAWQLEARVRDSLAAQRQTAP